MRRQGYESQLPTNRLLPFRFVQSHTNMRALAHIIAHTNLTRAYRTNVYIIDVCRHYIHDIFLPASLLAFSSVAHARQA